MTILYVNKDIRTFKEKHLIHGCNAQGKMGAGVALVLKKMWPEIFKTYKEELDKRINSFKPLLGSSSTCIIYVHGDQKRYVHNFITQDIYGNDKTKRYFNYAAFSKCLIDLCNALVLSNRKIEIAMPKIGAGLANGNWDIIENILYDVDQMFDNNCQFIIYDWDGKTGIGEY